MARTPAPSGNAASSSSSCHAGPVQNRRGCSRRAARPPHRVSVFGDGDVIGCTSFAEAGTYAVEFGPGRRRFGGYRTWE
jgi:hypothetical protein